MKKIWFITGTSRGLGRGLTEAVLKNGAKVAATARNPQQLDDLKTTYGGQILPLQLDVTDQKEIENAINQTIKAFGRIDVLVNNAGFGITGAAEAYSEQQVCSQWRPISMPPWAKAVWSRPTPGPRACRKPRYLRHIQRRPARHSGPAAATAAHPAQRQKTGYPIIIP